MTATITRIPVAMKRGRKVRKGPLASVSILFEAKEISSSSNFFNFGDEAECLAQLLAKREIEHRREKLEYENWIDASRSVVRFPESRRYRTVADVRNLKKGMVRKDEALQPKDQRAEWIANRCKEIVAGMEGSSNEPATSQ